MKRLHPEERKHIVYQTVKRLEHDWICRYGVWNTNKLLRELRLKLRKVNKPEIESVETDTKPSCPETAQALLFS